MASDISLDLPFKDVTPRYGASAAVIKSRVFLWRGFLNTYQGQTRVTFPTEIEVFDSRLGTWNDINTTGEYSPAYAAYGVVTVNTKLYFFGGQCGGGTYSNDIHEFDTTSCTMRKLRQASEANLPMKKMNCGTVYLGNGDILTIGGYGRPSHPPKPGTFILDEEDEDGDGWTSEVNLYNIETGLWSCPVTTGQAPPPYFNMTLTRVSRNKVVMFGGWDAQAKKRMSDIYILDTETWHWSMVQQRPGQPWPQRRQAHTAHSLWDPDEDPEDPTLIITCGQAGDGSQIGDLWIFHLNSRSWEKIPVPESFTPRWLHASGLVHISHTRRALVMVGGVSDNTTKYSSVHDWPLIAQTTVLEFEFNESRRVGGISTGWSLVEVKDGTKLAVEGETQAGKTSYEELLEQALQKGYVLTDLTKVAVSGPPGVGKSHLWYYLLNQVPPSIRCSTACIEQARRIVISSSSSDTEEDNWEDVGPERMVKMVAETISAGVTLSNDKTESVEVALDPVEMSLSASSIQHSNVETDESFDKEEISTPTSQPQVGEAQPDHSSPAPLILSETAKITEMLATFTEARQVLRAHFLLFLDTGGQPFFLDIFAAFIRSISLQLLVFKLSEQLKALPVVDYYSPEGFSYQLGHFVSTNEQLLTQSAQVAQSQRHQISLPCIEKQPDCPKVLVVGTFKDQESLSQETREEKNIKLSQSLQSLGEQLIRRSSKEVIFPVNTISTKSPGNRDPVSFELRNAIATSEQSLRIKYPLGYYLLESELRRIGRVVSRDQCWAVARQLLFESEEAMDAALQFLHEVSLILYYPEVLKNTVFINPMAVIGKVTQLYEKITELKDAAEVDIPSKEMLLYRNQAIFSCEFAKQFTSGYHDDLFTVNNLINILEYLKIIAALPQEDSTNYFMPSLLEPLEDEEIVRPSSGAAAPLFIHFENEYAPNGVFCALIVHLLSSRDAFHWKLSSSELDTPIPLNKSQLTLQLLFDEDSAEVEFINSQMYCEVHVNSIGSPEILPLVWEEINRGLQCVYQRFSYVVTHKMAFRCQCQEAKSHPAVLSEDCHSWVCTKNSRITGSLSDKQKLWLHLTCSTPEDTELKHIKQDSAFPGIYFLDDPWLASVTSEGKTLTWDEIGMEIDIPAGAVSEDRPLKLTVRPCLSGPFSLPEGYELVSPVYIITPAFDFNQDVQLSIVHYASLTCHEDCSSMAFMSAKTSITPGGSDIVYNFKVLRRGVFHEGQQLGVIPLRHFCGIAIGKKRPRDGPSSGAEDTVKKTKEDNVYSVQLYQDLTEADKHIAILCISLYHPVYIKNIQKCLDQWYPGMRFLPTVIEPALISEPKIKLIVPTETGGWKITSSRIPCEIMKTEVDFPKSSPKHRASLNYPPKIRLSISPVQYSQQQDTSCALKVVGFEEELGFTLELPTPLIHHSELKEVKQKEKLQSTPMLASTGDTSITTSATHSPTLIHAQSEDTPSPQLLSSSITAKPDIVLGVDEFVEITDYLLDLEKTSIYNLGISLGLSYHNVVAMKESDTFLDQMITAWLRREDQVDKRGGPTWRTLVAALRSKRVGQMGIAVDITRDKIFS